MGPGTPTKLGATRSRTERAGRSRNTTANYARHFSLSSRIDQNKIGAELKDGVLSVALPKVHEAKPRTIQVK
jgi:HSP20 family molecular chaperone IbpA